MHKILPALLVLALLATCSRQERGSQLEDIRYAPRRAELVADDPEQDRLLDIHLPKCERPREGYPVVVFVHGGGFSSGTKRMTPNVEPMFRGLLDRGYAVVSINYYLARKNDPDLLALTPEETRGNIPAGGHFHPGFEQAIEAAAMDTDLALKWLWKHGGRYGLDRNAVCLLGTSVGSITALTTAFVKHPAHPAVRAVVNCWGGLADADEIRDGNIPVLSIHGDRDPWVNVAYSQAIQQRMEELGSSSSRLILLEGRAQDQYYYVGINLMGEVTAFLDGVLGRSVQSCYQSVQSVSTAEAHPRIFADE